MSATPDYRIRQATIDDVPALHRLVAELAAFVGESDAFTATVEQYATDFREGFYEALVAENGEGHVFGMALYVWVYSTWKGRMLYLEDFVLEPAYRRRGIGSAFWEALQEKGRGRGCKLMKWQIVESNVSALEFYRSRGAEIEDTWLNGKQWL